MTDWLFAIVKSRYSAWYIKPQYNTNEPVITLADQLTMSRFQPARRPAYVCMYVCMYVCIYLSIYLSIYLTSFAILRCLFIGSLNPCLHIATSEIHSTNGLNTQSKLYELYDLDMSRLLVQQNHSGDIPWTIYTIQIMGTETGQCS